MRLRLACRWLLLRYPAGDKRGALRLLAPLVELKTYMEQTCRFFASSPALDKDDTLE